MDQDGDTVNGEAGDDVARTTILVDATAPTISLDCNSLTGWSGYSMSVSNTLAFTWSAVDANGISGYEYRWNGADWIATTDTSVTAAGR